MNRLEHIERPNVNDWYAPSDTRWDTVTDTVTDTDKKNEEKDNESKTIE